MGIAGRGDGTRMDENSSCEPQLLAPLALLTR